MEKKRVKKKNANMISYITKVDTTPPWEGEMAMINILLSFIIDKGIRRECKPA